MTLPQGCTQTWPHQLTAGTLKPPATLTDRHSPSQTSKKLAPNSQSQSHTSDRYLLTGSLMGHTPEQAHVATLATHLVGDPGPGGSPGTGHGHARAAPAPHAQGFHFPFPSQFPMVTPTLALSR